MTGLWQDLRFAARGFGRQPGFHALAVITIALGVASTTGVFSVLDGVVRQPLPYPQPDRLVQIASVVRLDRDGDGPFSQPDVLFLRENASTLESIVGLERRRRVLIGDGDPRFVSVTTTSEGMFALLGARPVIGRLFVAEDHLSGAPRVAVLSHGAWVRDFGGDADVLGRTIRVDGVVHEVIGVVSREFVTPEAVAAGTEIWTAWSLNPSAIGSYSASMIGRLAAGATVVSANAEANGLIQQKYEGGGASFMMGARVRDLRIATVGDVGRTLWLFLVAVVLLLGIAATNVANLMLARGSTRTGEVAVRTALGASRGRVARQLLTESLLVAVVGGVLGAGLAYALVSMFTAWGPGGIPRLTEISVDGRSVAFAGLVSAFVGVLFGIAPALRVSTQSPARAWLEGGRTITLASGRRLRGALVVAETALALVLVLGAGLLINSFVRMKQVDPGFEVEGLVALQLELRAGYEDPASWTEFWNTLLERIEALPGVESAALNAFTPFTDIEMVQSYTPEGADIPPDESVYLASVPVSFGWERTLGLQILEGRAFDGSEQHTGESVIMVNRTLADAHWPGERSVVGKRIKSGSLNTEDEGWYTVIGVVSDVRFRLADEPIPIVYHPHVQVPWRAMSLLARVDGDPVQVIPSMRRVVHEIDPSLPIRRALPISTLASASMVRPRFYSVLSAGFGALALLLALVGIYGTATCTTAHRSREVGIRIALGARQRNVLTMLTLDALRLALIGVAAGILPALLGARALEGYLFGVTSTDPVTVSATAVAVAATAALAAWLPARRAVRLDPLSALRSDA